MHRANVLVVDDEAPAVTILSAFLESHGHRCVGAGSAEEAAATLRAGRFDFVLLDVILPGLTGLQALPGFCRLTNAPIYLMSGQHPQDVLPDALLLGAKGFFPKPLDLARLTAAIDALPGGSSRL